MSGAPQATSRAVVFDGVGLPLRLEERPIPSPGPGQVLLRVLACGLCRTDLHLLDGEVQVRRPPRVLGHQIIGEVVGEGGRIVGVPWIGWTCGECSSCRSDQENLCPRARFTGCDIDGGLADHVVADERFCTPVPDGYPPAQAAPLLCAGVIGHRALRMAGAGRRLGIYGFGAAAHIQIQVARARGWDVLAFTREGDEAAQAFARELGAIWSGPSSADSPEPLDAAIIYAPAGELVPLALRAVVPGGTVVCGGIHMSDIPSFPYRDLWGERTLRSVANLTRVDVQEFLPLAAGVPVRTKVTEYPLSRAAEALEDLRAGRLTGAAVVVPGLDAG
ncbi:zinc-dependent alcohol dehydrogenase family protein [Paraconexibacter sp.]|uniref:zinc-dependent alcohol dehydrogenase family protein n=1 Tax=Paraconexibacter sp. TaxID=2949640 RepID=UPI00356A9DD3